MTRHLDQVVTYALRHHPDGRSPVELAEDTGEDYSAVLATLDRLGAAGVVTRSGRRLGTWHLVTDHHPGEPMAQPTPMADTPAKVPRSTH